MGDRISMSLSSDSPSDETLNLGPLELLLRRQYEFPFGINVVQLSFFFSSMKCSFLIWTMSLPWRFEPKRKPHSVSALINTYLNVRVMTVTIDYPKVVQTSGPSWTSFSRWPRCSGCAEVSDRLVYKDSIRRHLKSSCQSTILRPLNKRQAL